MKNIDWIESDNYFLLNYTIVQSLSKHHNFTSSPSQYLQFHNLSLYNLSAHTWCTGLVFTAHGQPLGMIRIDCNLKINASFFCQEIRTQNLISSHTLGMPYTFLNTYWTTAECDGGWARVGEYCFLLIKHEKEISWRESQLSCHKHFRASLWNITNISNKYEYVLNVGNTKDVLTFLTGHTPDKMISSKEHEYYVELMRMSELALAKEEIRSEFLELEPLRYINKRLLNLIGEITVNVRMYVEDCFFVKKHRLHKKGHAIVESSCDQKRNVTHLLCQKGVSITTSSCSPLYYECMDGTCILREYRCDGNNDCFQGDDEQNCKMIQYLSADKLEYLQDNSWWLFSSVCLHFYPIYETKYTQNCAMIHSLCDNIYDISIENTFCKNYSIDVGHESADAMSETFQDNLLFTDYFKRMCISGLVSTQYRGEDNSLSVDACDLIQCPFMFRCENSYCINIEHVCDGHSDCPYKSDEILCENTTCPGMLKCRGEKRCLPDYLICNNHVDCIYSADDELGCQPCPDKCNCSGYAILCFNPPPHNYTLLYKVVTFRYPIKTLKYSLWGNNAVFLDLSYCSITDLSNKLSSHSIIILNISNNVLGSLEKNHFRPLHHVHTVDASHNNIENIFGGKEKPLKSAFEHNNNTLTLIALLLSNNKITVLRKTIFEDLQNLEFISIEQNPLEFAQFSIFNLLINIKFIMSSDASICCFNFKSKTQCSVNNVAIIHERHCIIRTGLYLKIIWDMLAAGGFICCIFVAIYQSNRMKRSAYLEIIFKNHLLCSILLFVSIVITVHLPTSTYNVDILTNLNWVNIVLNIITIFVIMLSCLLTITRDICLTLKTLFPFRHQCRWLKVVPIIPLAVWILAAICGWVQISLIKQHNLIMVTNDNHLISDYFLTLPVLCLNVMLIFMSSICYKVLLSVKSSAIRQHKVGSTRKFKFNVHGNYFCQLILIIGESCILVFFASNFVSSSVLHFILPCFYYMFALRAFITVGGAVWIHIFFQILK